MNGGNASLNTDFRRIRFKLIFDLVELNDHVVTKITCLHQVPCSSAFPEGAFPIADCPHVLWDNPLKDPCFGIGTDYP